MLTTLGKVREPHLAYNMKQISSILSSGVQVHFAMQNRVWVPVCNIPSQSKQPSQVSGLYYFGIKENFLFSFFNEDWTMLFHFMHLLKVFSFLVLL